MPHLLLLAFRRPFQHPNPRNSKSQRGHTPMSTSRMFASSLDAILRWQSKSVRLALSERTSYALRARLNRSPPSSRPPPCALSGWCFRASSRNETFTCAPQRQHTRPRSACSSWKCPRNRGLSPSVHQDPHGAGACRGLFSGRVAGQVQLLVGIPSSWQLHTSLWTRAHWEVPIGVRKRPKRCRAQLALALSQ